VQDSLRARSNLSFELGLRYDAIVAPAETDNRFVVFDAATDSLVKVASPYQTGHNVQPRVGVIWNRSKTSERPCVARTR